MPAQPYATEPVPAEPTPAAATVQAPGAIEAPRRSKRRRPARSARAKAALKPEEAGKIAAAPLAREPDAPPSPRAQQASAPAASSVAGSSVAGSSVAGSRVAAHSAGVHSAAVRRESASPAPVSSSKAEVESVDIQEESIEPDTPIATIAPPAAEPAPPPAPARAEEEEIVEPAQALPDVTIEQLPARIRDAARRAGWARLMPVQAKTIPYILARRDLMVQSRTGSGKTGAFVLPILERIDPSLRACQALVLVPTRELAHQVAKEAELLAGGEDIRTVPVYGGVAYGPQIDGFRAGAHIVVGTPGRILDHLLKRSLTFDALRVLVFDEADRMLSMGFYPDMKEVQRYFPRDRRYNAYMFSATLPPHVLRLAREFLATPELLSLSRDRIHVAETQHLYYCVPPMDKDRSLVRIIEIENPTSAIIFCNTKQKVHYVNVVLQRFGYDADELSADLTQMARESVMARLKKGQLRFLVATDVAARGIDIHELSHVFLYEPPEDQEAYIHRAGRTGRAGAVGTAISLVADMEEMELRRIARRFNIALEKRPLPSDADVQAIVSERITALLEARLRDYHQIQRERMQRFVPLARNLADSEDELAVVAMLLDDYYQQTLHAPPAQPAPVERSPAAGGEEGSHGRKRRRKRR
jgi:ATP-dependent RNA helicase DeaD